MSWYASFTEKKALLCLAVALSILCSGCNGDSSGLNRFVKTMIVKGRQSLSEVKGKVKTRHIKEFSVDQKFGKNVLSQDDHMIEKYNKDGKILERLTSDQNGTMTPLSVYAYDKNGILTDMTSYKPSGSMIARTIFEHNAEGLVVKESQYYEGELEQIKTIHYYQDGRLKEEITSEPNGLLVEKNSFVWGENGYLKERTEYSRSIGRIVKSDFEYDDKGRLIGGSVCFSNVGNNEKKDPLYGVVPEFSKPIETKLVYQDMKVELSERSPQGPGSNEKILIYDESGAMVYEELRDEVPIRRFTNEFDSVGNVTSESKYLMFTNHGKKELVLRRVKKYEYEYY